MLRVAVPNKGALSEPAVEILADILTNDLWDWPEFKVRAAVT